MNDETPVLRLLGLGARGRLVVIGVDQTRKAVADGKVSLAVVAADVSQNSLDKIVPLLRARGITMIETASAAALGNAVGRETTAVVGVLDPKLARGVTAAWEELGRTAERVDAAVTPRQ
jgi:ribosomal protein L7Ae-like RNA K-turn-binding protein